ncbi:hypothetical protein C8Q77DRAFT_1084800 [Trametes polyzona]|nr:hypothetical protein C8Q77DRAFT_1084800 [Trametes polyzona]
MGDLSLRHLPDLSDASAMADFSDASFQIPRAVGNTVDLLADDTMDFFDGADDTLSTPAPPSKPAAQPPLTLAELTPRSKHIRSGPVRSSLRPRPGIATPYKAVVAHQLSAAISEDLSPLRSQDPSFQLPSHPANGDDLLMADISTNSLQEEGTSFDSIPPRARSPLTLSQLSPGPSKRTRLSSSATPGCPDSQLLSSQSPDSPACDGTDVLGLSGVISTSIQTISTGIAPVTAESAPTNTADKSSVEHPTNKGIVHKDASNTNLAERQKKLSGGDRAKRKRVTPAAAISKPAKLKPLTASLARRVSLAGRKPVPGMRRRPLVGPPAAASKTATTVRRVEKANHSAPAATRTDVKPARAGGALADTLLSFGQKLMASAARPDPVGGSLAGTEAPDGLTTEGDNPVPLSVDRAIPRSDDDRGTNAITGPNSLVTPREPGDYGESSSTMPPGSPSPAGAPADILDQQASEPQTSDPRRPSSPMRRSIKRAGSPAEERPPQQRKRSKTTSGPTAASSCKESVPQKPTVQPSRARNALAAVSHTSAARARRVVSASASTANLRKKAADDSRKPVAAAAALRPLSRPGPVKEGEVAKPKGPGRGQILDGDSGAHAVPSASSGGRSGGSSQSEKENHPETQDRHTHDHLDASRGSSSADKPPSVLPSAKPTRPVGFQFATSVRVEARKVELEKSAGSSSHAASLRRSKAQATHPIPDFKTLHALQESVLAQRKAEITPVVPLPIELSTEARARERERFEEARRAREAELERQREERRRQQELEEEREIKELRKRAVPKANEVPEWYAFAPKKSKAGTGS